MRGVLRLSATRRRCSSSALLLLHLRASSSSAASSAPLPLSLTLRGPADTLALGARLATVARAGDALLLHGDYGAGKTCLARGFLRHWYGDPAEQVTSPSYLIDNVYDDPEGVALLPGVTVHHMDLWRLPEGKIEQLVDLPHVFRECISLIEWPQRLTPALTPEAHLDVHLAILGEDGDEQAAADVDGADDDDDAQPRVATLTARGAAWEARLAEIRAAWEAEEESTV